MTQPKTVICVDAKCWSITEKNNYEVLSEAMSGLYLIKGDDAMERWIPKDCFRDSEPQFTYGQEVETINPILTQKAKFLFAYEKFAWIFIDGYTNPTTVDLTEIRPLPTLKQRIVEVLKKHEGLFKEELAERIIELVNKK